jgi:formate dehydrogenase major subunit
MQSRLSRGRVRNMSIIKLNINGKEVMGIKGQTILEVARENKIDIPTLCYDERVKIYGSCGLCVVEIDGAPRPLRACATQAAQDMIIKTNTQKVREARKIALELLLSDHLGDCRPPCRQACPGQTDCQGYVGLIANGMYKEAVELIKENLPLPASIGRVCPHPCEDACRRNLVEEPVSIAYLKSFVGDKDLYSGDPFMPEVKEANGKHVAIVGAGPSGLTAAYFLGKEGYGVTIYEAMDNPGGMLRYGIPEYRLPKKVLDDEIQLIKDMGVEIITGVKVGKDISLDILKKNFDAVYLAIGAWKSSEMRCKGEDLPGVLGGIDFLKEAAIHGEVSIGNTVAVIGGGNTAMDAARTSVRLGAGKVMCLYRRTREEMPAEDIEVKEAMEEGVEFHFLIAPLEIIAENDKVTGIKCQKMELGEPDSSGRRKPVPIEGAIEIVPVDTIISAIGQKVNPEGLDIGLSDWGTIAVNEKTFETSIPGVFAGGDAVSGPGIAIEAIAQGKKAAEVMLSYLAGNMKPLKDVYYVKREDLTEEDFKDREKSPKAVMPHMSPEIRRTNFFEVNYGISVEEATRDALRCLECGCHDIFECKLFSYANEYKVQPERLAGEVHNRNEKDDHPFMDRNPDKCILCGLCVRMCDENVVSALGLVDRGFDTIVKPEFGLSLKETSCVSCGQCVSVCPTGALQERLLIKKSVPVTMKETNSICSYCSVGCNLVLNSKGNTLFRALPNKESKVDGGYLCIKGRFGFDKYQDNDRITSPMIRKNGELVETTLDEAIAFIAKKTQSVKARYGGRGLGIYGSPRLTNEELYLLSKLGKEALGTDNLRSFNCQCSSGLDSVLGYDSSTVDFDQLASTELILNVGGNLSENQPIAGMMVKQRVQKGGKLILIEDTENTLKDVAAISVKPVDSLGFIKEILAAVVKNGWVNKGFVSNNALGYSELEASLQEVEPSVKALEIAKAYVDAKKAIILFEQGAVSSDITIALADLAVLTGKVGSPRSGIIALKPRSNSQGLTDMGFRVNCCDFKGLKGVFIMGEDPIGSGYPISNELELLVVQDIYLTETAKIADVVLPASTFAETKGTYTNSERRLQTLDKAFDSPFGYDNCEIYSYILEKMSVDTKVDVWEEITLNVVPYKGIRPGNGAIFTYGNQQTLYMDGFGFDDKKARLLVPGSAGGFKTVCSADAVVNRFVESTNELLKK